MCVWWMIICLVNECRVCPSVVVALGCSVLFSCICVGQNISRILMKGPILFSGIDSDVEIRIRKRLTRTLATGRLDPHGLPRGKSEKSRAENESRNAPPMADADTTSDYKYARCRTIALPIDRLSIGTGTFGYAQCLCLWAPSLVDNNSRSAGHR